MDDRPGGYQVLVAACSAELREKGSKFLARVHPVEDAKEARLYRERLAGEHHDASHHCWAERLGWPPKERFSDAGEPRGTAGDPIVRVLRSRDLSDVVAVVVRWFGGTKLGKGGLVRAYREVVASALETGRFERRYAMSALRLSVPYDKLGAVKRLARTDEVEWVADEYGAEVIVDLRVRVDREQAVREMLADLRVTVRSTPEDHS